MTNLELREPIFEPSYNPGAAVRLAIYDEQLVVAKTKPQFEQLEREEGILKAFDDPNLPKTYGMTTGPDERNWLLMEYMPGLPLDQFINLNYNNWKSDVVDPDRTINIVDGLAGCIQAVRDAGYYYRDLNLGNVIVSEDGVSLVDHEWDVPVGEDGFAKVDSRFGNWESMPEEEFSNGGKVAENGSVYALGSVLAQLTTGKSLFFIQRASLPDRRDRREATRSLHRAYRSVSIPNKKLEKLISAALEPKAQNRIQTIAEFRSELAA